MPDLAMLDYFYGDEAEQFTFYRIPKVLFTDPSYRRISSDAKILYGLMLDRMGLSVRNGWLDEYNRVFIFFTLEDALEYLCCGHTKAVSLFGELDKAGLIERKKQGQGKPTKIYVKNFVRNAEVLTSEKRKSKVPQSGSQDFQKTASNNTEIKDTELSDTEPSIYPVRGLPEDKSPAADAMDTMRVYRQIIMENIEYGYEAVPGYDHEACGFGSIRRSAMKKKANIYDADDVERSKRLNFTPEERAARAEHKAEVLGTKLEKAKKKVPKKKKLRLQKELDPEKSKLKHTLRFEEVEKKRGQEALPKKAGRRMVQSASATVHSKIHQVEEENVGTKAAHRTELASEGAAALASHEIRKYRQNAPYKRVEKLEAQVNRANVSAAYRAAVRDNPELQENTVKRLIQKQRIKHQYAKEFRKAKQAEKQGSAFVQKAKDMFGSIGQTVATAVQEHKGGLVMAGAIAMLIIMVFSSLSSCSVMMDGAMSAVLGTSYTSEDPDIIQTEANYTALETALQNELANIERTHPGYDEYRYDVDSIGHNPNELISYLTAKFDAFTPAQVQAEMETMFDRQYSLTTREVVEIRTRTVTSTDPETGETTEDEEEYEYYILYVTLRNKGFGAVALENLDEEQKERYTATLSLKGNKPYLFGSDIYANESAGEDYDIPGEALADPDFAALIAEAEKYLGFPYVWGGSSPSTSFDCSGFVCYVYTHSGVHNLPRTTAQGIYNQCAHIPMSEAKPGDIIFFTGTYNSPGPVSHVGIYVGNNMMIHCGSPIQYARTDSSYWSQHFYAIGRLN